MKNKENMTHKDNEGNVKETLTLPVTLPLPVAHTERIRKEGHRERRGKTTITRETENEGRDKEEDNAKVYQ